MPDPIEVPPPDPTAITAAPPPPPPPPPKRGVAWLAWVVIALVVGFELLWPHFRPTPKKDAGDEAARRVLADVQAREIVGMAEFVGQRSTFYAEAKKNLDTGPVPDRLRFIVVAGELEGPAEALKQLQQLEERAAKQGVVLSDEQRADVTALEHLYQARKEAPGGPPGAPLTEDDRERLRGDLGWCGELALTPPDDPDRAAREAVVGPAGRFARTYLAVIAGGLFLGMLGLVGLVAWFAFFLTGHIRPALPPPTRHGGVYAEAFAVYMAVFLGLGVARAFLPIHGADLLLGGVAMLLSLAAGLAWPVLRGVPWRQVRQEIGLTLGRHPLLEPLIGLGGYALILPVFGVGIIISVVLLSLQKRMQLGEHPEENFNPVETPTHPIVEWLGHPDWRLLLQVVILASVLAPLVEEAMFRGVLYRHLRNASARLGRHWSFLVSALVVSFIFAVIHPQGALAVPALMALAFGLNILREWRGSLLPSMIVHGVHNGLTTFVLVKALGG